MENLEIYQNIASRTDGDIYVGVVGPVRTGKSTFIKKFMELLVLPNMDNSFKRERAIDELPLSASGKTIMTTEPKFIPNEAVEIMIGENLMLKTRLVDCVGYLVDNALGYLENDAPRMVKTPWSDEEMPFELAAEIGTKKVIEEHSTIGILVTTDGSVTDIERSSYIEAEERVVKELKALNKPFVIVLNSNDPLSDYSKELCKRLEEKYEVSVIAANCESMSIDDMSAIFSSILYEFPIERININFPKWIDVINEEHWLKKQLYTEIKDNLGNISRIKEFNKGISSFKNSEIISNTNLKEIQLGNGSISINLDLKEELFYKILTEISGVAIDNESDLFSIISELAVTKKEYDKIAFAMHEVKEKGYGIVTPTMDELQLEEPEMLKQGSRFGIKLKAKAPSIHMIRADIETEVAPIVGSEKQSEELVNYLLSEFETDPKKIWESNIFGKSLHELVNEGLQNKLTRMPDDAQCKIQETLERIINEGSGGLICIIL